MLSELVVPGQVVDLEILPEEVEGEEGKPQERKIHRSKVFDILSEDQLEIMMPTEKGVLITVAVDARLDLTFHTEKGLQHCFAKVADRYKSDNIHLMVAEVTSSLKKAQRREYYRLNCAIKLGFRKLAAHEAAAAQQGYFIPNPMESDLQEGTAVDISGGGMRFTAQCECKVGEILYCTYNLVSKAGVKRYDLLGRVMRCAGVEKRPGLYEIRIQYIEMDRSDREEIIKFIFEEERRQRHRAIDRR